MSELKLIPTSEPIDMDWSSVIDTVALRELLEEHPPYIYLPVEWDLGDDPGDGLKGPPPSDPLTLYFQLPFTPAEETGVTFSCTLEAVLDDMIALHMSSVSKKVDCLESKVMFAKVSARLRQLADKLDEACAP